MRKAGILTKGLMVFAAAAALQFGASSIDASAAAQELSAKNIKVDFENQKLVIGNNGSNTVSNKQIYYGVATVKTVSKKVLNEETGKKETVKKQVLSVANWDQYDYALNMTIDLSALNRAKDNYIQVKGSSTGAPITIKIPKVVTKVQAKFDASTAQVVMNDITNKKDPQQMTGTVEYRTNYSGWKTYAASEDLTVYQDRGATLYFRMKAVAGNVALPAAAVKTDDIRTNWDDAEAMDIYVGAGTFPGQEVKCAIGKRANAPAITPNYLTQVVTMPVTAEYRLVTTALGAWTAAPEPANAKAKTVAVAIDLSKDATLEVRTAKTATKPASKIKTLEFAAKGAVPVIYYTANAAANKNFLSTEKSDRNAALNTQGGSVANSVSHIRSGDISKNKVVQDKNTDLVVPEYALTLNRAKTAYATTKLKLTNNTSDVYEIIVADADAYTGTDLPAATAKVTATIAAGTTSKAGVFTPKATSVAIKEGQLVFIRKKGVAKTKVWATDYIALGTVKLPAITTE